MTRRHPHVFGDGDAADLRDNWETHKAQERAEKAARDGRDAGILDDVPRALRENFSKWSGEAARQLELRRSFAAETDLPVITIPWLDQAPTTVGAVKEMVEAASGDLLGLIDLPGT